MPSSHDDVWVLCALFGLVWIGVLGLVRVLAIRDLKKSQGVDNNSEI